mmetsp:Transcript_8863/g.20939  ORF Transcript_8863/g.20939 Transcript_8863/m.20939 type:complete len:221 (-) Transcript_8863:549-1211(-)
MRVMRPARMAAPRMAHATAGWNHAGQKERDHPTERVQCRRGISTSTSNVSESESKSVCVSVTPSASVDAFIWKCICEYSKSRIAPLHSAIFVRFATAVTKPQNFILGITSRSIRGISCVSIVPSTSSSTNTGRYAKMPTAPWIRFRGPTTDGPLCPIASRTAGCLRDSWMTSSPMTPSLPARGETIVMMPRGWTCRDRIDARKEGSRLCQMPSTTSSKSA